MSICTLCKSELPEGEPEAWTTEGGEVLQVEQTLAASALANTSVGEFEICEACYLAGLPSYFTPEDVAEIHFQFGGEYTYREQFPDSAAAYLRALRVVETADILAGLAHAENALGNQEAAVSHYQRALKIDPSHFIARENLKKP